MTESLTFTYSLDPGEQARVTRLLAKRFPTGRLWKHWGIPILAAPVVIALILGVPLRVLQTYAVALVVLGVLALAVPAIQRWQAARALAATPALAAPVTYRLTEEGIVLQTAISSAQLSWEGVESAEETPDMFVVYFAGRLAYYIPKRVTQAATDSVRELLRERLGDRAKRVQAPAPRVIA